MPIKILMVIDDDFRYAPGASPPPDSPSSVDFTYTALTAALANAGFEVTKANRHADNTATPGFAPFAFDALPPGRSLLEFDLIWMIGLAGRNVEDDAASIAGGLGPSQLNKIAAYMEAGGGVFATGDHDSVGCNMGGWIPRVRVMRTWYGATDTKSPFGGGRPAELNNFSRSDGGRADTVYKKMMGDVPPGQYPSFGDGHDNYVWFENQSDHFPQKITPIPANPAHPILRHDGHDVTVYPDHMHEGNTIGELPSGVFNYMTTMSPYGDTAQLEFRKIGTTHEKPKVIATGKATKLASRYAVDTNTIPLLLATESATEKTVNTLSVYDGRNVGVGRIVTGSTFHHYVDINLIGSHAVTASATAQGRAGSDAVYNAGLTANGTAFADITAVFVNIATWLARPRPAIQLILERSTFSQDEATATPIFPDAVLVTVDGLKPNQFPGGGVAALGNPPGLAGWAPVLTVAGVPIALEPTKVDSDDPGLPDRVQRFTFTYQVHFTGDAFTFPGNAISAGVSAAFTSPAAAAPLTDQAWIELIKSANPFMLDLDDGNTTAWLSSDIRSFRVVEGQNFHGVTLPMGADRAAAIGFITALAGSISEATFVGLPRGEAQSALSSLATTTGSPARKVYNFALARVRVAGTSADADPVRVFFRIFTTQTTAALTYHLDGGGVPLDGYLKTPGATPIALPGTQSGGSEWVSFPFFAHARSSPPASQIDPDNLKPVPHGTRRFFGALIDNNLGGNYLPSTPGGGGAVPLPQLLMGEHQCLVAQIEFAGAPIPNGATPWTSDKLAQRNLAVHPVANPGLDASRVAIHTFELEATPFAASEALPPDELLLEWSPDTPEGTMLRLHIPGWQAQAVVHLADRFYPRHEIRAIDAHTIELPGGGTRYVPLPLSVIRQTGVIEAEFPLGIRKGQRFDVAVRHITNQARQGILPPARTRIVPRDEIEALVAEAGQDATGAVKGAIALAANKVLVTDLSLLDGSGDHAVLIEHPAPEAIARALRDGGRWRQTIGAFQLGVPVSTREEMLLYHLRLLSVMRWRAAHLARNGRWYATMQHYVELLVRKVQALGGDPWKVPATPDGDFPGSEGTDGPGGTEGATPNGGAPGDDLAQAIATVLRPLFKPVGCAIVLAVLVLILLLFWQLLKH